MRWGPRSAAGPRGIDLSDTLEADLIVVAGSPRTRLVERLLAASRPTSCGAAAVRYSSYTEPGGQS